MSETKGLFIDPTLHKEIKKIAAERGITMRQVVEDILREEMKKNEGNHKDKPRDIR